LSDGETFRFELQSQDFQVEFVSTLFLALAFHLKIIRALALRIAFPESAHAKSLPVIRGHAEDP